jgi:hypothetical protein
MRSFGMTSGIRISMNVEGCGYSVVGIPDEFDGGY